MAGSITISGGAEVDNRPIFTKNSRLSDDDVVSKVQAINGVRTTVNASGVAIKAVAKPSGPDSKT